MARACPSPYGERGRFLIFHRSASKRKDLSPAMPRLFTVARGPSQVSTRACERVPSAISQTKQKTPADLSPAISPPFPVEQDRQILTCPSPAHLLHRRAWVLAGFHTRMRAGSLAISLQRSAGACPPRGQLAEAGAGFPRFPRFPGLSPAQRAFFPMDASSGP